MEPSEKILAEVQAERNYQIAKWGNEFDDAHSDADWTTFAMLYLAKAVQNWKNGQPRGKDLKRRNLIKVAAIIVAWVEAIDRA